MRELNANEMMNVNGAASYTFSYIVESVVSGASCGLVLALFSGSKTVPPTYFIAAGAMIGGVIATSSLAAQSLDNYFGLNSLFDLQYHHNLDHF